MDEEYELLEDDLSLAGFAPEFFSGLLLARLTPFSALEKAASSILLVALEDLLDPEDGLAAVSEFLLEDEVWEGLGAPFLLRLDD